MANSSSAAAAAAAAAASGDEGTGATPFVEENVFVRRLRGRQAEDDPAFAKSPHSIVNVCSTGPVAVRATLSPFFLGPVKLPFTFVRNDPTSFWVSRTMENAWQYSKVYVDQVDPATQEPLASWFDWAKEGFNNTSAVRFPKGPGARPLYSFGGFKADGTVIRLKYVEARFRIYAPLYAQLVDASPTGLNHLRTILQKYGTITLRDFDGWDRSARNMTLKDVMYNPNHKCGHGFVLAMMLVNNRLWEEEYGGEEAIAEAIANEKPPKSVYSSLKRKNQPGIKEALTGSASKSMRLPVPLPIPAGISVAPVFQKWAQDSGHSRAASLSERVSTVAEHVLTTEDGSDPVEKCMEAMITAGHNLHKAKLNGTDVAKCGPHMRALLHSFLYAMDFPGRPPTAAATALLAEPDASISTINAEVDFLQSLVYRLQDNARAICRKEGYIPPRKEEEEDEEDEEDDEDDDTLPVACFKCESTTWTTGQVATAPTALGRNKTMHRFYCSACFASSL